MLLTGSSFLEHLFRCQYPIRSSAVSRGCPACGLSRTPLLGASEGAPLLPSHRPFSSWSRPPGSRETHPQYDILSSDTHSLGSSRKGQRMGGGFWIPPLHAVAFAFTSLSESRRISGAERSWRYWICAEALGGSGPSGLPWVQKVGIVRTRDTTVSLCKLQSSCFLGGCSPLTS